MVLGSRDKQASLFCPLVALHITYPTYFACQGAICWRRSCLVLKLTITSGASAIVLVDLRQEDADQAARDLVDWFGQYNYKLDFQSSS